MTHTIELALGTAQFGLDYGVTNSTGQIHSDEAKIILKKLAREGHVAIDTAPAYGDSEIILGQIKDLDTFAVSTKLPHVDWSADWPDIESELEDSLQQSLENLKLDSVERLWLHQPDALNTAHLESLIHWFETKKHQQLIRSFGASIYYLEAITHWHEKLNQFDWIQAPGNILDQAIFDQDVLDYCQTHDINIQIRSVFLQGLLLAPEQASVNFPGHVLEAVDHIHQQAKVLGTTPHHLCVDFIRRSHAQSALVGVSSIEELNALLKVWHYPLLDQSYSEFALTGDPWLNPANWS